MEWPSSENGGNGNKRDGEPPMMTAAAMSGEAVYSVRVMTDEQMEILRKQIGMYAEICEQLIEMHKSIAAHNGNLSGMRLGGLYCDPLMLSGGSPKISARQRWTPTPMQLQMLESLFDQGIGTPNKQRIKEITSELTQHGQISETNVYNWFQNRRARSKRKQATSAEVEGCSKELKGKLEKTNSFRSLDASFELRSVVQESKRISSMSYLSNDSSKSSGSIGQMSLYEHGMLNPRINQATGEMEISRGLSSFQQRNRCNMSG